MEKVKLLGWEFAEVSRLPEEEAMKMEKEREVGLVKERARG